MISKEKLDERLRAGLNVTSLTCYDMTGGGDHWQVKIRSVDFAGKSMIEQHQLVYKVLGDWMKQEIHALSLDTGTP